MLVLNIDLLCPDRGPSARVAVELDAPSARALAEAILETLDSAHVRTLSGEPA